MKRLVLAAIAALATTAFAAPVADAQTATPAGRSFTLPVVGSGSGATFTGTFELKKFATDQSGLVATGTLTGVVTDAAGKTTTIMRNISMPAVVTDTTCEILHLDLGPISLDLLGLQIDLSRIVLDITAQAGAGNLLGNLLCAVVNLLNDPTGLARLLNQILDVLR